MKFLDPTNEGATQTGFPGCSSTNSRTKKWLYYRRNNSNTNFGSTCTKSFLLITCVNVCINWNCNCQTSSPVTSTFAFSQASSSESISFEGLHQGPQTIFELYLKSDHSVWSTVTEVVWQQLLAWFQTGEYWSNYGPLWMNLQHDCLKPYTSKNIMRLMKFWSTNKSSLMKEPERNYLILTFLLGRFGNKLTLI